MVEDDYEKVEQFRNCKSLYEAYEQVNDVLNFYTQKFFLTDIYLQLIFGINLRNIDLDNNNDINSVSNGNKNSNDHSDYGTDQSNKSTSDCNSLNHYRKLQNDDDDLVVDENFNDLSKWNVSIPFISSKLDEITNRENYYFEIHVYKSTNEGVIIERQYTEFYILESKLKEFHGDELKDISLPARKSFIRINRQLLENQRTEFEQFLQQLLSNNSMKRSKLFYNFLNSNSDCFTGNFNLTKLIRNVPSKFAKEKGQHLCAFLKNFIISCEKDTINTQTGKKDGNKNDKTIKTRKYSMNWPNLDTILFGQLKHGNGNNNNNNTTFQYIYDIILAALIRFYQLNNRIKNLFFIIRPLFRQTLQGFFNYFLRKKIKQTFTPEVLAEMIEYLKNSQLTLNEKHLDKFPMNLTRAQRSELALNLLKQSIPKWLLDLFSIDSNKHEEIIFLIFSLLQYRLLNKQLLYLILDLFIAELYPNCLLDLIDQKSNCPN